LILIILIDYNQFYHNDDVRKSPQLIVNDSIKGGSLKKLKCAQDYVKLDSPNQPITKFPSLEKESRLKSKAIASVFNITKNKRFSLLDSKKSKEFSSHYNDQVASKRKIKTRNAKGEDTKTFVAFTDGNVFNMEQWSRGLIPRIKPKVNLFAKKVNSIGCQPTPEKKRFPTPKFADSSLLKLNQRSVSGQSSFEIKKTKLRWYNCRPRLIINRYYRENFVVTTNKNTHKITIADIWQSAIVDKPLSILTKTFGKSSFSPKKFAKLAKSIQMSKSKVKRNTKKINKSYKTN